MSANIAFRSHLMQQFTAAARSQSRPPLALASMPKGRRTNGQIHDSSSSSPSCAARTTKNIPHQTNAASPVTGSLSTGPDGTDLKSLVSQQQASSSPSSSSLQRTTATNLHTTSVLASSDKHETDPSDSESVASSFQTLLMKQTAGYYSRSSTTTTMTSLLPIPRDTEFWRLALDRAVQSAQQQHVRMSSRDGPIQLKRILGSSLSLKRLGDIVFECALQKHRQRHHSSSSSSKAHAVATKKRDKWMRIPAYLVALLQGQPNQEQKMVVRKQNDNNDNDPQQQQQQQQEDVNPLYQPYQFVPPETEQQLDDVSVVVVLKGLKTYCYSLTHARCYCCLWLNDSFSTQQRAPVSRASCLVCAHRALVRHGPRATGCSRRRPFAFWSERNKRTALWDWWRLETLRHRPTRVPCRVWCKTCRSSRSSSKS